MALTDHAAKQQVSGEEAARGAAVGGVPREGPDGGRGTERGGGAPFARPEDLHAFRRLVERATNDPAARRHAHAAAERVATGTRAEYAAYLRSVAEGRALGRFPARTASVAGAGFGAVGLTVELASGAGPAMAVGMGALVSVAAVGGALLHQPRHVRRAAAERTARERRRIWLAAMERTLKEQFSEGQALFETPPHAETPDTTAGQDHSGPSAAPHDTADPEALPEAGAASRLHSPPARGGDPRVGPHATVTGGRPSSTGGPEPASEHPNGMSPSGDVAPEGGAAHGTGTPEEVPGGPSGEGAPDAPPASSRRLPLPRRDRTPTSASLHLPVRRGPFLGRDSALARVSGWARPDGAPGGLPSPCVVVLHGPPGAGRTALAVAAAELLGERYHSRCLVSLRGGGAEAGDDAAAPLSTRDALLRLLNQLGAPKQDLLFRDPASRDTHVRRLRQQYQEHLTHQPAVLILDDAADAAQVRPLVPVRSPSLVLITSREPLDLGDQFTTHRLAVGALTDAEAEELFAAVAGREPGSAGDRALLRAAQGLPLALCMAGAAVARGAGAGDPFGGPEDPQAVLRYGYLTLEPVAQQLFRRLALIGSGTLGAAAAAALLDPDDSPAAGGKATQRAAATHLDALCRARMVEEVSGGRFRLPDMLRAFALRQLAEEDSAQQRSAAQERLVRDYAELAERVIHRVEGASSARTVRSMLRSAPGASRVPFRRGDEGLPAALNWLDEESGLITAALRQADDVDPAAVQRLVEALCDYCLLRGDLYRLGEIAELARGLGEPVVRSVRLRTGIAARQLGQLDRARTTLSSLVSVYREGHNEAGAARALCSLGITLHHRGNLPEATAKLREALELQQPEDQRGDRAWTLHALGAVLRDRGELDEAWRLLHEAQRLHEETESLHGQAWTCLQLGQVHLRIGEVAEAEEQLWLSQELYRMTRDARGEAWALTQLGRARLLRGEAERAVLELNGARTRHREQEDARGEAWTLYYLGQALEDAGRLDRAEDALSRARHMFSTMGDRYGHACARHHFGRVTRDRLAGRSGSLRNTGFARQLLHEARQDFRAVGLPHGEAWSCVELAVVDAGCGRISRAVDVLQDARELFDGLRDGRGASWATFLLCTLAPLTSDDGLRTAHETLAGLLEAPGCHPTVREHARRWMDGPWLETHGDGPWPVWRLGLTPSRGARDVMGTPIRG
ncbi:tetratricopeptide repeat protein [Wenjunlia vitaminophila]|uniref:tetratricopeptide repeat protein n=1 Tax=Wenjunlia vitaminophila TaxID=76728 RepID=UPI00039CC579|nr:tetratricopeptide repeat protein [Wenjunlia vitaminophila]